MKRVGGGGGGGGLRACMFMGSGQCTHCRLRPSYFIVPPVHTVHYTWVFSLHRTFKQDCSAHIALKANEDGTALQVRSINLEHNHSVSKVKFEVYKSVLWMLV